MTEDNFIKKGGKNIKMTLLFFNAFSTVVSLSQKSNNTKSYHKKLDKKKREKIDKNGTFIHQHRPTYHIVAKNQQQPL